MKKYKVIALSALIVAGFTSCDLTEKPTSYYEKDTYFKTTDQAKMSVIGIYDCLAIDKHYGQFEMAMPCSDDTYYIQGTGTDNTRRDIAHYMVKSTNTWIADIWEYKYMGIDRANFAITGIEKMAEYESSTVLKELVAQARFLRGFLAFDLIKYWGDVPFKTTYTSGYEGAFNGRVNREDIYDQIIADLDFAKENLQKGNASLSPETPSQGAAHALLMRVYLQRAGYSLQQDGNLTRPDEAKRKEYFNAVISEWTALQSKGYHGFYEGGFKQLFMGYSAGILNSKESLWEIAFNPTGSGYKDNSGTWATYNGPAVEAPGKNATADAMGRANAFFRVLPAWKDFFEANDERRDVMVCTYRYKWDVNKATHKKVENAKLADWYPGKWRREWMPGGFVDPNNTSVNYCPLRYADVVLMAAEAYNETGNTPEAWNLLNSVRTRANATPITATNYNSLMKAPKVYDLPYIQDGDAAGKFRTALYWERGFELAFEGQRKYDLLRWGILGDALKYFQNHMDKSLKGKYVAGEKFITGKHELFPIPLGELQSNPALNNQNNPGYE
ncbi:RagB/SusD family nutrient uptake outer membrane protein [Bacteroides helcogenes]|uniref:RagB/SusD domain protein n=1 Tax=Bacteroides helcogenes (strain ATCC 35417 / DSM 20613 / JCM 6297 / CCUG 15421 / P 36-108) TaxID=693979 RepID=E6SWR5_BACT6|nr:RagB/SusD family nutrient uptake outer membrane protein [Bacteroides helcogenes]ADV43617.1 RagB/SusD domain protein [Bacteroides helcogenes P 36-108]MDY5239339.1 RagB/SusD family nutrient uptake outer membrane protein [Bacteroides helcogenes]